MSRIRMRFAIALAFTLLPLQAFAQFPNKPVRIVSPAPPAGVTDIIARLVASPLQEDLKQPVIVENKGGAGGLLGAQAVVKSAADGYSLLVGGAFVSITAILHKDPSFVPARDLVPIAIFASAPNLLVAGPQLKVNSVAELVALAKARPGQLKVGSNGVGTTLHLAGELFKLRTGVSMLHIPYRGWGDAVAALTSGEVDMMFDNMVTAFPLIQAGKTRPLAVAAARRHRLLPDVPTLAELGINDAEVTAWFGIMTPTGTPQSTIDVLERSFKRMASLSEFQKSIQSQGMDAIYMGSIEAAKFWKDENDKWANVISAAKVTQ